MAEWTQILVEVAHDHDCTVQDMLATGRYREYTEARKDAARRLHDLGYENKEIARILRRDLAAIRYYLKNETITNKQ